MTQSKPDISATKSPWAGGLPTLAAAYLLFFVIVGGVVAWLALAGPPETTHEAAVPSVPQPMSDTGTAHEDHSIVSIDGESAKPDHAGESSDSESHAAQAEPEKTPPQVPLRTVASADPDLIKKTPLGDLPVVGPNGKTAWQTYAQPFSPAEDGPRLGVIVEDLGLNRSRTEDAIDKLPPEVTLAFSPYADGLQAWVDKARSAGHEVILSVPMEPISYPADDPGPDALLTSLAPQQNIERLHKVLGRVTGYVGVMNSMGSKFTASTTALTPVMDDLSHRGLLFVDSSATRLSVAAKIARTMDIPRALNNRYVDNDLTADAIDAQLGELERVAQGYGAAVGLARAYPISIERLQAWIPTLRGKGIQIAPISAIVNRQPIR